MSRLDDIRALVSDADVVADRSHMIFCQEKQVRVADKGGPEDLIPIMECWASRGIPGVPGGCGMTVVLVPERGALPHAVRFARQTFAPIALSYNADGYTRVDPDVLPSAPGQLAAEFAAGDMSVGEQLMTVVVLEDGSSAVRVTAYTYDDDGMIVFGETTALYDVLGDIVPALRDAF